MLLMARASRLLSGSTVPNVDKGGLNLRNQVWDHAMLQGILHAVRCSLYGRSIDSIQIILDEKTMAKPRRELFSEAIHRLGPRIQEYLERLRDSRPGTENQKFLSELRSRIRFSSLSTTVHWSDDTDGVRSEFPLKLVDRLARKMFRLLMDASQAGIEQALREAGFEDFLHDITHVITRPLSQRAIDAWKRDTGLPEPSM